MTLSEEELKHHVDVLSEITLNDIQDNIDFVTKRIKKLYNVRLSLHKMKRLMRRGKYRRRK